MIDTPPSARKIPAVPADPAEHAVRFAHTWADRLEHHDEGRMHALDIPEHQIGASDLEHGVPWRVFFPHERTRGGNVPGGRITVDSGVLNPELNAEKYGPQYASLWKKARLRDRIDSIIVHEYEEAKGVSHEEAVARAGHRVARLSPGAGDPPCYVRGSDRSRSGLSRSSRRWYAAHVSR